MADSVTERFMKRFSGKNRELSDDLAREILDQVAKGKRMNKNLVENARQTLRSPTMPDEARRIRSMANKDRTAPLQQMKYGGKVEKMMYGGSVKEMEAGGIAGGNCRGGGAALRGTKFSGVK